MSPTKESLLPLETITQRIVVFREQKVLLDSDLATLYGVETRRFNEQVRRNTERFPEDFMFQLSQEEWDSLRSQFATLKMGRGQHRKYLPYVFTEHGAIMAATVLNSPSAVEVSIYVVRAFVRLREMISSNKELSKRLDELEQRIELKTETVALQHVVFAHNTRAQLKQVFDAIRVLMTPPDPPKRSIGFVTTDEKPGKPKAAKKG